MNKILVVLALISVALSCGVLYAGQDSAPEKTARGTQNIVSGWVEVPKRMVDATRETRNPIWGVVAGVFQGTLKAVSKTASGVTDVVTAHADTEKK